MANKRQVVFIENVLWGGGAEKCIYDLVNALDKNRFEPHIVHLYHQDNIPVVFDSSIHIHCVEVYHEDSRTKSYNKILGAYRRIFRPSWRGQLQLAARSHHIREQLKYKLPDGVVRGFKDLRPMLPVLDRVLEQFDDNAIFVPVMEEATIQLWLSQMIHPRRYIASLHTAESYNMPVLYPDPQRLAIEKWMLVNACDQSEMVIFPSAGCKADFINQFHFTSDKIIVIPNPINLKSIQQQSHEQLSYRLPEKKTVFVQVANLTTQKNHPFLLDACQILKNRYDDFVVFCLGEGPMRETIQSEIEKRGLHNHVVLLGNISNPYPFMAASRAVLLTSYYESFGLVLVEAMACGTVPVSVDCPFGPREVLDNGRYGMLLEPDNPQGFAEAMLSISRDDALYSQYRQVGEEGVLRYDIAKIKSEWESVIGESSQQ